MPGKLTDNVAIITGATSGIGRSTALLFAKEGAKLVLTGRREKLGQELVAEIAAVGGEAVFVTSDVTKSDDIKKIVATAIDRFGRIDILVNNAGVMRAFDFAQFDETTDFDEIFDTNVKAYFLTCREVIPHMLAAGKGSIVNTASIAGMIGVPNLTSYAASKGAILQLTKSLSGEYARRGIRVNAVVPGLTLTDMVPGEFQDAAIQIVPMKRAATPDEIAPGYLFLASDDASFCTGTQLVMDGGALASEYRA